MKVISSITGNYDKISENQVFTVPYVMYSNQTSSKWELKPPFDIFNDQNRNSKIVKVLSHKFSDEYSLWIDGNIDVLVDPESLIKEYLDGYDICFFNHPLRDCVYDEYKTLVEIKKDSVETMTGQINRYRFEGYPEHNGLQAGSVILRRHTPQVVAFNNLWWSEITCGSKRDQLSLDYCLFKTGLKPKHFPGYHQKEFGGSDLFISRAHL